MNDNKENIDNSSSEKENKENTQFIIDFLSKKRDLQWEINKSIENKAVQIVVFSGAMITILINFIDFFPGMKEAIKINFLHINCPVFIICIIFYLISIIISLFVLFNPLFSQLFNGYGFINENIGMASLRSIKNPDDTYLQKFTSSNCKLEMYDELFMFSMKNKINSKILHYALYSVLIALFIIIVAIFYNIN
ncbi:MAG: hypothetical protein PWQ44_829 [Methanolobus sp.]|nr:hypothetical protein [Methanolobus sp.]